MAELKALANIIQSSADSIFTKEKRCPSSSLYSLCLTVGSVFGSNPHADPHLLDWGAKYGDRAISVLGLVVLQF